MPQPLLAPVQAALAAGDLATALRLCGERPGDADAHRYLGQIHAANREPLLALRHAQRACELAPDDARSWSDLGRIYALQRRYDDARQCLAEALRVDPRHADSWHNLGTALRKCGDREGAFTALKNALLLDEKRADTYLNLGNLLIDTDQFDDAVECFERAARLDPRLAGARSQLGQELSQRGKVRRAETLFRQSVGLDPDHVQGWFGLGRTLEDLGEAEGALAAYRQAIQRRPRHAQAIGQYLALVRGDADEAQAHTVAQAEAILADTAAPDEARALVGYGLAKYHDRRRDHAQAAQAGLAANAARRHRSGVLDRDGLARRVDGIIATYTRDFFHRHRRLGLGTDQPVFIVGLPRSGTTLTEQLLSAHPLLHGAGELPDLANIATQVIGAGQAPWQAAAQLDEMGSREPAQRYLRALQDGAPATALRISDKSPLNFFHLALAALLFPNARVIHCRREPRDNALSIWMENFGADQRYATDFGDLAFFTAQYRRLMAHWRQHLPLPIFEMQYEDTVADLEARARSLIDFVGAPWDARCLSFHQSARAVQTPSRWQVRQPIYQGSVARWKAYAHHLPELDVAFAALDTTPAG